MEALAYLYLQTLPNPGLEASETPWVRPSILLVAIAASLSASALPASANRRVLTPHGGCLNLRSGPGMEYSSVGCLASGTAIAVQQVQGTWVQLADGNWTFGPYTVPAASGGTGSRPPCPSLNGMPVLDLGSRGASVIVVQEALQKLGYSTGAFGADGIYGLQTKAAVRQFQKDRDLLADGRVGPQTWKALADAVDSSGGSGSRDGSGSEDGGVAVVDRVLINPVDANAEIVANATVRRGPNVGSETTGEILRPGSTVTVLETLNDWHRLRGNSAMLWVPAGTLQRF